MELETRFTRKDWESLPDDFRAELIEGHLVKMPAPTARHQQLVSRLMFALASVAGIERVLPGPIGFLVGEHDVLVPDVVLLDPEQAQGPLPTRLERCRLVVEVASPSTARRDRENKVGLYLRAGVEEVWIVAEAGSCIEVHTEGNVRRFSRDAAADSRAEPGLSVPVAALFA